MKDRRFLHVYKLRRFFHVYELKAYLVYVKVGGKKAVLFSIIVFSEVMHCLITVSAPD